MENKDEMRQLDEEELDKVAAGGINFNPFGPDFATCTKNLKEAGDRAWVCSSSGMFGTYSPLHSAISSAEHASDNQTRLAYVKDAWNELANGPEKVREVKFKPGDYEFIKTRVDLVYNALNVKHIIA